MESVTLVQCKFASAQGELAAIHGDLALQVIKGLKLKLLEDAKIVSARFKVKFTDSKTERMVTIKSGNEAEFKYDDDGRRIEAWLIKRGFLRRTAIVSLQAPGAAAPYGSGNDNKRI
jgi:hypothetical protein